MAVELKEEAVEAQEAPVPEEKKLEEPKLVAEKDSAVPAVERSSSFKEESNFLNDLKESERKALIELRAKVEEAILENKLFKKEKEQEEQKKPKEKEEVKEVEKADTEEAQEAEGGKAESCLAQEGVEGGAEPEKPKEEEEKPETVEGEGGKVESDVGAEQKGEEVASSEPKTISSALKEEEEEKSETQQGEEEKVETDVAAETKGEEKAPEPKEVEVVDKEVCLWGVPLFPSKGFESTDVVLLKFLRARDFKVKEAFEMLQNALQWRKEWKIDEILDEDTLETDLGAACYMDGVDREGHPVCYNVSGFFEDSELYHKTFGSEEGRKKFLRWRVQVMEKGIKKLDFKPSGVASLLQVTDLKNSPGLSKKELRTAMKQVVELLQDNYPEFVARNIVINVPFWYYAFSAILSPFLTQRTKSKFVIARPSKVTETLLKYIPVEAIPIKYGGLKRENDTEFSAEDGGVSELIVKAGSTESVEIPCPEAGATLVWDLTVLGWEVNYKEEFVPTDEGSYTIIVKKGKKMGSQEEAVRNSFRNYEPGKIVLTIENGTFKKKKVLFRYKAKSCSKEC
ncbi:patellin-4 [Typha angustifolia]|uniref:patellin-4 n=1 Tax=Typha angustifolia TaxID=59011 RepID=UPI003C30C3DD